MAGLVLACPGHPRVRRSKMESAWRKGSALQGFPTGGEMGLVIEPARRRWRGRGTDCDPGAAMTMECRKPTRNGAPNGHRHKCLEMSLQKQKYVI
jgi:hypothetical protein